jgi:transposase
MRSHRRQQPQHRFVRKVNRRRHLVEVFFHNVKRTRPVATRYEKTARNYLGLVQLVCTWLWLGNQGHP